MVRSRDGNDAAVASTSLATDVSASTQTPTTRLRLESRAEPTAGNRHKAVSEGQAVNGALPEHYAHDDFDRLIGATGYASQTGGAQRPLCV